MLSFLFNWIYFTVKGTLTGAADMPGIGSESSPTITGLHEESSANSFA